MDFQLWDAHKTSHKRNGCLFESDHGVPVPAVRRVGTVQHSKLEQADRRGQIILQPNLLCPGEGLVVVVMANFFSLVDYDQAYQRESNDMQEHLGQGTEQYPPQVAPLPAYFLQIRHQVLVVSHLLAHEQRKRLAAKGGVHEVHQEHHCCSAAILQAWRLAVGPPVDVGSPEKQGGRAPHDVDARPQQRQHKRVSHLLRIHQLRRRKGLEFTDGVQKLLPDRAYRTLELEQPGQGVWPRNVHVGNHVRRLQVVDDDDLPHLCL